MQFQQDNSIKSTNPKLAVYTLQVLLGIAFVAITTAVVSWFVLSS
jgi:hypothetical protein